MTVKDDWNKAGPGKPLTKPPGYYLTSDEGSECERLEPAKLYVTTADGTTWKYCKGYQDKPDDSGTVFEPKPFDGCREGNSGIEFFGADMGEGDQTVVVERDENGEFTQIDLDEFKKQCEDIERGES